MHPISVYVYGTLKRGHCREKCWPRRPLAIEPATAYGRLFDLGPYPALAPGEERILGELWRFDPDDMNHTLAVLDRVEGADLGDPQRFTRQIITCYEWGVNADRAYAYLYARPDDLRDEMLIQPNADGYCVWTT